jgi:hypothetical protein
LIRILGAFAFDAVGEFRISIETTFPATPYGAIVGADGVCPADPGGRRPPLHEFANGIAFERTFIAFIFLDPPQARAA